MNLKVVLLVLVVLLGTVLGMPQYFGKKRKFPGQRLRGATNYGTHSFGGKGFSRMPISRYHKHGNRRRGFRRFF